MPKLPPLLDRRFRRRSVPAQVRRTSSPRVASAGPFVLVSGRVRGRTRPGAAPRRSAAGRCRSTRGRGPARGRQRRRQRDDPRHRRGVGALALVWRSWRELRSFSVACPRTPCRRQTTSRSGASRSPSTPGPPPAGRGPAQHVPVVSLDTTCSSRSAVSPRSRPAHHSIHGAGRLAVTHPATVDAVEKRRPRPGQSRPEDALAQSTCRSAPQAPRHVHHRCATTPGTRSA